jgi:hypothetical protein
MAGAFGYEKINGHYDVGVAVGERALLPQVRKAGGDELIIADGFSCQEQIEQQTDRAALHSAVVLRMAMRGETTPAGQHPENFFMQARRNKTRQGMMRAGLLLGVSAIAAITAIRLLQKSRDSHRILRGEPKR